MAKNDLPKWTDVKKQLDHLGRPELMGIIQDLFRLSTDNRTYLGARFTTGEDREAVLEEYRERVIKPFFPKRGFGKLNLAEGRKAIRDYSKATSDAAGTLDLMLTYVESGTRFTREYGDIEESFYNSLESVLNDASKLLMASENAPLYPGVQNRLHKLRSQAGPIGWGYGDTVTEVVEELEEYFKDVEIPEEKKRAYEW